MSTVWVGIAEHFVEIGFCFAAVCIFGAACAIAAMIYFDWKAASK